MRCECNLNFILLFLVTCKPYINHINQRKPSYSLLVLLLAPAQGSPFNISAEEDEEDAALEDPPPQGRKPAAVAASGRRRRVGEPEADRARPREDDDGWGDLRSAAPAPPGGASRPAPDEQPGAAGDAPGYMAAAAMAADMAPVPLLPFS